MDDEGLVQVSWEGIITKQTDSAHVHSCSKKMPAFAENDLPSDEIHWVEPKLVAQIGFEEWTDSGKLHQPRFQGLRRDKDPEDVVKEETQL